MELTGVHNCKVDAKGRLKIPSSLQLQLKDVISQGFIIKLGIFKPYLELYPRQVWNEEVSALSKLNRFVQRNIDFIRLFMAGVREIESDGFGRILIPKDLATQANIKKDIVLAAVIDKIEIWDKDYYDTALKEAFDDFPKLSEQVMGNLNQQ